MTAVTATAPPATPSAAEMEVDYGYGDTGIDYGYGDDVAATEKESSAPFQPGGEEKQNGYQAQLLKMRRLSSFVGIKNDPAGVAGGGNQHQQGGRGGAGGGEKKRRGRRLSMFAFAGQENDLDEFNNNKNNGSQQEDSHNHNNHKGGSSKPPKPESSKTPRGLMRKLSDDIGGSSHHTGGGMLGSFFRGGGGGGSSFGGGREDAHGASNGPIKRRGRRLSMIAFDGENNMSHDEVVQEGVLNSSSPPLEAARVHSRQESGASFNSKRRQSIDSIKTGSSGNEADLTKKNRYYPPVQLPAEYLADASTSKPITRVMGLGVGSVSTSTSANQAPNHPQLAGAGGGAPPRIPARAQRRSSFGGATTATPTAGVTLSPEQPARKVFGRNQAQQAQLQAHPSPQHYKGSAPGLNKNRASQGTNNSNGQTRNGSTVAHQQQPQLKGSLSQSQHGGTGGARLEQPAAAPYSSPPSSPRSQRRAVVGRLAVQSIPGASIHKVAAPLTSDRSTSGDSHEEGVIKQEESDLHQYMKSMELETSSSHSTHVGALGDGLHNVSSGTQSVCSTAVGSAAGLYRKEVAAIAREARAAVAAGVEPCSNNMSLLYILARCCDWSAVLEEVKLSPRDAKVVSEKDGTTALHLAVMSRTNPIMRDGKAGEPAPMEVIDALVQACPEAAIIRCAKKRYTPLCYACLVADVNYDMEDCSRIVELLIKHAPHCPFVFTDDGFSALDIHILSYSQLHNLKEDIANGTRSSAVVLEALLNGEPSLADARVYRNKIRGPLELLYRCNIDEFKEAVEKQEELELHDEQDHERAEAVLRDWWAWKWTLMLLRFASISAGQDVSPFKAVHAAARLVGCPLPVLALAVNTYPKQVSERDPTGDIYNLPLHEVCSWRADSENIAGDPFIATRKFKAMRMLLEQFPEAARMTNNCGETPLQLAVETCTPWHGGLEALVEACPKALKFPRKLRITDNGLSLAVANHSAIDSIATNDSDEPDPLEPMENMYPFLVSAVLGGVSRNKLRPPVSFSDERAKEHYANLERKDLQAVRAVYGLLRARPEVLAKYRQFVVQSGV